jgi:hypothetical protein
MICVSDKFPSIEAAREAISRYILNKGELYKVYKSDKTCYILICRDSYCKFRIRASKSKKDGVFITKLDAYSCTPATYYNSKLSYSMWYLKDYYRASVIDNRDITPAQIRSDKRLRFSNYINY